MQNFTFKVIQEQRTEFHRNNELEKNKILFDNFKLFEVTSCSSTTTTIKGKKNFKNKAIIMTSNFTNITFALYLF
jgi:hypothetical protein